MTNNKIVAGSLVRVLDITSNRVSNKWSDLIGTTKTVERVLSNGYVKFTDAPRIGGWAPSRFELVRTPDEIKIGTYIISLQKDDGTLLPAAEPKKYSSDAQAHKIAEMMAAKHGGKFLVFRAIGEYEMPQAKPTFRPL